MVQIVIHSFVISYWKNSADSEEILYILFYLWTMLFLTTYLEVTQLSLMFISKHMMIQIIVCTCTALDLNQSVYGLLLAWII